jgi:hypothetical protein
MSRGHGEVQRFVLRHLLDANAVTPPERYAPGVWDNDVTVRGIATEWVHFWLTAHEGHDCREEDDGELPAGTRWYARHCGMKVEVSRSDMETVRRALKSLERERLVKLNTWPDEVLGIPHLSAALTPAGKAAAEADRDRAR